MRLAFLSLLVALVGCREQSPTVVEYTAEPSTAADASLQAQFLAPLIDPDKLDTLAGKSDLRMSRERHLCHVSTTREAARPENRQG